MTRDIKPLIIFGIGVLMVGFALGIIAGTEITKYEYKGIIQNYDAQISSLNSRANVLTYPTDIDINFTFNP